VLLATLILLCGFDPIKVTVLALIFSAGALPLTFYPMLIVADDRDYMGESANGLISNTFAGCTSRCSASPASRRCPS
jgi:manganese transport protein